MTETLKKIDDEEMEVTVTEQKTEVTRHRKEILEREKTDCLARIKEIDRYLGVFK